MAVLEIPLFCFPQTELSQPLKLVHPRSLPFPPPRQSRCCPLSTFRQPLHCYVWWLRQTAVLLSVSQRNSPPSHAAPRESEAAHWPLDPVTHPDWRSPCQSKVKASSRGAGAPPVVQLPFKVQRLLPSQQDRGLREKGQGDKSAHSTGKHGRTRALNRHSEDATLWDTMGALVRLLCGAVSAGSHK